MPPIRRSDIGRRTRQNVRDNQTQEERGLGFRNRQQRSLLRRYRSYARIVMRTEV